MFFASDQNESRGAFGVSFESGIFSDPIRLQGLAHFHEHMVSMGTKQYPDQKSFKEFHVLRRADVNAETHFFQTRFWSFIDDNYIVEVAKR